MQKLSTFSALACKQILFICLILGTLHIKAQDAPDDTPLWTAQVIDGEHGDPIPYATVYIASGLGTITNRDGNFSVRCAPDAMLRISSVGYETVSIRADRLPQPVRLKPMARMLDGVSVIPIETIVLNTLRKLDKECTRNSRKKSKFFYRMTASLAQNKDVVEAILEARDAVNLRELRLFTGIHGSMDNKRFDNPFLAKLNFHHPLELGPVVHDSDFWDFITRPDRSLKVNDVATLLLYYNVEYESLKGDDGHTIYCVHLTRNPKTQSKIFTRQKLKRGEPVDANYDKRPILVGDMYIDAETLQLLRFCGKVEGMKVEVQKNLKWMVADVAINLNINYQRETDYTQVHDMSVTIESGDLSSSSVLLNVGNLDLGRTKDDTKPRGKLLENNVLAAVHIAGFDGVMWKHANFIQRTQEEEQLRLASVSSDGKQQVDAPGEQNLVSVTNTSMSDMVNRLQQFGRALPQEKVYVHMDNTSYFLGDTIWFSAYTRLTSNDAPSNLSGVLYVELLNHEGYLQERKLIQVRNGRGNGYFALNPDWKYTGYYELRAYTRWQLNWGAHVRTHSPHVSHAFISEEMENHYFRDYDKLYSRVFPVYDKTASAGSFAHNMTPRPMRLVFKTDPDKRELMLSLFPEGGDLVVGQPCRVAFEAAYNDGEWVDGTLTIDGTTATTVHRGRGTFIYTPQSTSTPRVSFTTTGGLTAKGELPKPVKEGVSLMVEADSITSEWVLKVRPTQGISATGLGLTIMHEGVLNHFSDLTSASDTTIRISSSRLPLGVNQVTVFDASGRVYADRLFFVNQPDRLLPNTTVKGLKSQYAPYEKVSFRVHTTVPQASLSLSVRDMNHLDRIFDDASMLAEMLLSSEIKGFVPNPDWYFEADDALHREALDLLMLTQGWRRFDWRSMAVRGTWELSQPDERTPVIVGKVVRWNQDVAYDEWREAAIASAEETSTYDETRTALRGWAWKLPREVRVHAELVGLADELPSVADLTTKEGMFRLSLPPFEGQIHLHLAAADTTKWKRGTTYTWVQPMTAYFDAPEKDANRYHIDPADYNVRVLHPYPRFVKQYDFFQQHLRSSADELLSLESLSDGTTLLREVEVGARRTKRYHFNDSVPVRIIDGYEAYNETIDAGMKLCEPYYIGRTMVGDYGSPVPYVIDANGNIDYRIYSRYAYDALGRAVNDMTIDPDSLYLRENLKSTAEMHLPGTSHILELYSSLTTIDKYVYYSDYQPRFIGSQRYRGSNLPETNIVTYIRMDEARRTFYRDRRLLVDGFASCADFYHPNYERAVPEVPADYRRTLYWNPSLPLSQDGAATVTFFNNATPSVLSISAEGMGAKGEVISYK